MKSLASIFLTIALTPLVACVANPGVTISENEPTATTSTVPENSTSPARSARGHSKDAFFDKYDVDGNGRVTEAEYMSERENGYRRRDADGDGTVHSEEYVSEYEVRLNEQQAEQHKRQIDQADFRFTVLDVDNDGILTLEEFHASGERMFSTLDSNDDGIVDGEDDQENY
jgi:EF hand